MFSFDKTDLQRIAISMAGALMLATLSVASVSTAADRAAAPVLAAQAQA